MSTQWIQARVKPRCFLDNMEGKAAQNRQGLPERGKTVGETGLLGTGLGGLECVQHSFTYYRKSGEGLRNELPAKILMPWAKAGSSDGGDKMGGARQTVMSSSPRFPTMQQGLRNQTV